MNPNQLAFLLILLILVVGLLVFFLPHPLSRARARIRANRQPSGPIYRDDDRYWYGGLFYYNPDDPDPFIPKRFGFGWTVNFGHPVGKLFLLVMLAMILLPVMLAVLGIHLAPVGCHPSNCPAP